MAKNSSKKSIHTHVPTKVGLSILALVVLVFGSVVATQYNASNQTATGQSEAAGKTVTNTKQCISWNTANPPKCLLYQQTTTTVNTTSPCVGYNTSGKCVQYQDTTQNTITIIPQNIGASLQVTNKKIPTS